MAGNLKRIVRALQGYTNEKYLDVRTVVRTTGKETPLISTANRNQAAFEAVFLNYIGYGICPQHPAKGTMQPFGIRRVTSSSDELVLEFSEDQESFETFVSTICPTVDEDGHVGGIPGLRVTFAGAGIILRRVHAPGRIVLKGCVATDWWSALERVYDDAFAETIVDSYVGSMSEAHEVERGLAGDSVFECDGPALTLAYHQMLSGIIRRAHAFVPRGSMKFLDLWSNPLGDRAVIHVEWAGDLNHFEIVRRLTDRRFGLPLKVAADESCYCPPCTADTYSIELNDILGLNISVFLRRSHLYDDELSPRRRGACQLDPGDDSRLADTKGRGVYEARP